MIRDAKYPDETPNEGDLVRSGCGCLTGVRHFVLYVRKASKLRVPVLVVFCGLRASGLRPLRVRGSGVQWIRVPQAGLSQGLSKAKPREL